MFVLSSANVPIRRKSCELVVSSMVDMLIESANIYWATSVTSAYAFVCGWTDNI